MSEPNLDLAEHLEDLFPVLRTLAKEDELFGTGVVSRPVLPNLAVFAAIVQWDGEQPRGVHYVFKRDFENTEVTEDQIMDLCLHNLAASLQADACGEAHAQLFFTLSSRSGLAASAIALPDFYRKFREWVGADALLLGIPDPSTLLVCDAGAEKPKRVLTEAVRESKYAGAVSLEPCILRYDTHGLSLVEVCAEKSEGMNEDPSVNCVVFEFRHEGRVQRTVGSGPTKAPDCVRTVWLGIQEDTGIRPKDVRRIYSEWEPAAEDLQFIQATFPSVELTYSFTRPSPDGWDRAMQEAVETLRKAGQKDTKRQRKSRKNR